MNSKAEKLEAFARLFDVLDTLRAQCPWDREQTKESIRANTIEEVYELSEAILQEDYQDMKKELGDVLLHVCFYALMAQEEGHFDIADVCNTLCNKLIFRHPHVYGVSEAETASAVVNQWELVKQKEHGGNKTVLSGVPQSLPSLVKAYRIQDKARAVGFDWKERSDVWNKVEEELNEVKQALAEHDADAIESEMGDLLFAVVNAARLYDINPDNALERTNRKFIARFGYIESKVKAQGRNLKEVSLGEMDALWEEAKCMEQESSTVQGASNRSKV